MRNNFLITKLLSLLLISASTVTKASANLVSEWNAKVSELMIKDGFSPVLASRTFMYLNVSSYLILEQNKQHRSIPKLSEISHINITNTQSRSFSELIAINEAMYLVAKELCYRPQECEQFYQDKSKELYLSKKKTEIKKSKRIGAIVAKKVLAWASDDAYKLTKAKSYYIIKKADTFWKPTPPEYREPLEPHWGTIKTSILDSCSEFLNPNSTLFSTDTNSSFFKQVKEVYDKSKMLSKEEKEIAIFWDDNPDQNTFVGHIPTPRRNMSPPSHWINITKIAVEQSNADLLTTCKAFTWVSMALEDSKISVWYWKYKTEVTRPVTYIRQHIDKNWMPILVTPPFPEYPSGHSTCSMSAALVLEFVLGKDFEFTDNTLEAYGIPSRSFSSFKGAAMEVSDSRFYGGIHYKNALIDGMFLGEKIAEKLINKIEISKK